LVIFAVAVSAWPGCAEWLQYNRDAIARLELWRLLTSHFTHWSGDHLFWDALAFAVLGWLCERNGLGSFLRCVGVSAFLIPLTLWFALPQMTTYRGLSGIDSALFALLATRVVREAACEKNGLKLGVAGIVSVGFAAKVAFELSTGTTLFVDTAARGLIPVPLAHVIGGIVGIACGLLDPLFRSVNDAQTDNSWPANNFDPAPVRACQLRNRRVCQNLNLAWIGDPFSRIGKRALSVGNRPAYDDRTTGVGRRV
jgi:rhomboid family GlyGly-CTERM serine protease